MYPNPWPKPKHLRRRWYAHPVFPELIRLGGELELRCNWRIYAEEFHAAMEFIAAGACTMGEYSAQTNISLFERKYSGSGHTIYRCYCSLDSLVASNQHGGELQPALPATHRQGVMLQIQESL